MRTLKEKSSCKKAAKPIVKKTAAPKKVAKKPTKKTTVKKAKVVAPQAA